MNIKQFKLVNNDEIVCEFVESVGKEGDLIVRKMLKIFHAEDYNNGIRYYSFKPMLSFQDDLNSLNVLNCDHIVLETEPSKTLLYHYTSALDEIERVKKVRGDNKDLNIDEIMMDTTDMSTEEIAAYLQEKYDMGMISDEELYSLDSADNNVIHLNPKGTMH
tara:strand:- start:313 stop:798 length:486 start_codon:yes stop_codon:yes gene_type:complete